eukprot:CAMPEP_0195534138 /NCGR_PEP_ID=MMETSP0794_2-20130614/41878_1 /TAXON_ID=515487 /ORGANISM="Stephanopyxis turris, Strain CCMP 815" /LENGTH=74 /DNA_ID=CAMNT_0040666901 /DNA_START=283 /DNA_END=504 /DNA_ORIENTATION=-
MTVSILVACGGLCFGKVASRTNNDFCGFGNGFVYDLIAFGSWTNFDTAGGATIVVAASDIDAGLRGSFVVQGHW